MTGVVKLFRGCEHEELCSSCSVRRPSGKGPYIKDVRTGRGEGGSPKADIVREVARIHSYRSSQNSDKGEERGSKNLKILRTSFMYGP